MNAEINWISVFSGMAFEADALRSLLAAENITTWQANEVLGRVAPYLVTPGGAGAATVLVREADVARAEPLAKEFVASLSRGQH